MAIDKVAYWVDIANEDLDVAEDLYITKRGGFTLLLCAIRS